MHLGFLGFGLIAGSVARAVRANAATADWTMAAWSPTGSGPASALAEGIIDRAAPTPESALDGADVVVLGAPATACLELIDRLAGPWRDRLPGTAVVTDVASTKARLVERADAVGLRFVGGHPMAGLERTGFAASDADLFRDRPWILVPGAVASPADVARVEALARACSARPIVMDAGAHDRAVAGISHLPLVTAVALVEAVTGATEDADLAPVGRRLAHGRRSGGRWLARHDPARPRRPGDGGVDRGHQRGGAGRPRPRPAGRPRCVAGRARTRRRTRRGRGDPAARDRPCRARARTVSAEQVYVVPRSAVVDAAGWYGIRTDGLEGFVAALERDGRYAPRDEMEGDPSHKQVIPYLVLRDGPRYLLMQRTAAGADARLHHRYSIGVGGHLNPGDGGLLGGLRREWAEELVADFVPDFRLVGLLNDDTTPVGRVHLGAVYVADAAGSAGGDPRGRQARAAGSSKRRTWRRSATGSRPGAGWPSNTWRRATAPTRGRDL